MADATYNTQGVYEKQGGLELVVAAGGTVTVESGGAVAVQSGGTLTLASGSTLTLPANAIEAADLGANLGTGYIPLPLGAWRTITSNDFGAIAVASGNGGQLATDTTPILQRINAATDKKARIAWAANDVTEIQQDVTYPPDLDDTAAVTVNLIVYKGSNTDTGAVIGVAFFEGIGDTNAGGNTAAITETVAAQKTVVLAASDVGVYPKAAAITLTPGVHANDAIYLLGAYLTYTRRT